MSCYQQHNNRTCHPLVLLLAIIATIPVFAQHQITSISTANNNAPLVTFNGVKGAGLRQSSGALRSSWDSTGTNFTVKFNAAATGNIKSVMQYTVSGLGSNALKAPVNAVVKLRRVGNSYVNDTRTHHNFWATYSSIPAALATSGTFNFTAPEVILPEDAFMLNNITSGYDNIFENTITNLHASNIERVDFIIPDGLSPHSDTDRLQSGAAIFDRGNGDPFKIAAIKAINASGDPTLYGNLISVTAANFGNALLPSSFDYCIITRDPKYKSESRPSSPDIQNLKGVYVSLADLGIAVNETFYGYSLFANDVTSANPDWTTYPTNTSTSSGLDPVNVMGLYKTPYSVLSVPMQFEANKISGQAQLSFRVYSKTANDHVLVERSPDGRNYEEIAVVDIVYAGNYQYIDQQPLPGDNFYRLKLAEKDGSSNYTEIRRLVFTPKPGISVYPNPASGNLSINFPGSWQYKKVSAELIDISGRIVIKEIFERASALQTIRLEKLVPGTYTLRLLNMYDHHSFTEKIIVNR